MRYLLIFMLFIALAVFSKNNLRALHTSCSCVGCDFSKAKLPKFILGGKNLLKLISTKKSANGFVVCDISKANFANADLTGAYFSIGDFGPGVNEQVGQVMLVNADFSESNLKGAHFIGVQATGADFSHANMQSVKISEHSNFESANFTGVNMQKAYITPPMGACGAHFDKANMTGVSLKDAYVVASFNRTNLTNADLSGAKLISCVRGKPLKKAILCHTKLSNGKLSNRDCHLSEHLAKS